VRVPEDSIAVKIKRAREIKRWTQQELADRLGVNRKTVDNWENGRTIPRSSIGALEHVLGVSFAENGEFTGYPDLGDPNELVVWNLTRFSRRQRKKMIDAYRQDRDSGEETGT
jgi:transcriptional regulator with XRE-family HTH domain